MRAGPATKKICYGEMPSTCGVWNVVCIEMTLEVAGGSKQVRWVNTKSIILHVMMEHPLANQCEVTR